MSGVDARSARTATNAPKITNADRGTTNAMVAQNAIPALSGLSQLKSVGAEQLDVFAEILARLANRTSPAAVSQNRPDPFPYRRQDIGGERRSKNAEQSRDQSTTAIEQRHRRNDAGESSEPVTADENPTLDRGTEPTVDDGVSPHQGDVDGLAAIPALTTTASQIDAEATTEGQVRDQPGDGEKLAHARAAADSAELESVGRGGGTEFHGDTRAESAGVSDGQRSSGDESHKDRPQDSRNHAGEPEQPSDPGRGISKNARAKARSMSSVSANPMNGSPEGTGSMNLVAPRSTASAMPPHSNTQAAALADAALKTAVGVQAPKPGGRHGNVTGDAQLSKSSSAHGLSTSSLASSGDASVATGSAGTTRADQREIIARVKLVQRVSKAFQHLGPEGGSIRLRLAPAQLGSVRVEMQVRDHRVRARVVTETEAATHALREHLPDLRSRLESQGMQLDSIEVETATSDSDSDASRDGMSRWQSREDQRRSKPSFTPPSEPVKNDAEPGATVNVLPSGDHQGVDVRV